MAKSFMKGIVESVSFCEGDKTPFYLSGVRTGANINKSYKLGKITATELNMEYLKSKKNFVGSEFKDFREGLDFAKKSGVIEVHIIQKKDLPFQDDGKNGK